MAAPAPLHPYASFKAARDRVPAGGVPDTRVVVADRKLACMDAYRACIRACRLHLRLTPNVAREAPPDELNLAQWRALFSVHATEMEDCDGMSPTLMGLHAWALQTWCADLEIRTDYPDLQCINDAQVRWACWSTQHTYESRRDWPTSLEWARYKRMVCAAIVHGWILLGGGAALELKLIHTTFLKPSPVELDAIYEERRCPPALAVELAAEEKAAKADMAAGKKDVKIGVSAEASGTVWREQPEERVIHFPFKMARLIACVDASEALLMEMKPRDPDERMRFSASTHRRMHKWMRTKLLLSEQPEAVTGFFRDLAVRMCLPLGSDTERFRKRHTIDNKKVAIDTLSHEIGANLAQYINNHLLKKDMLALLGEALPPALGGEVNSDTTGGLVMDAIFATLFEFEVRQKLHFQFMEQFVVLDMQSEAGLKRMRATTHFNQANMCPFIVWGCRRWWLRYQGGLLLCGTEFLDAVLSWLAVMKRDFTRPRDGKIMTEQDDNVAHLCSLFLAPDSLLPPPVRNAKESAE